MFYTASFFQGENHHGGLIPISRSVPRNKELAEVRRRAAAFKDHPIRGLVAPKKSILDAYKQAEKANGGKAPEAAKQQYRADYWQQLDSRKWEVIGAVLDLIRRGGEYTFLCWEHAGNFCHRNIFLEWLEENGYSLYVSGQDSPVPERRFKVFISGAKHYGDDHFSRVSSALDNLPWDSGEVLLTNTPGVSELAAVWAGARGLRVDYFTPLSRKPEDIAEQLFSEAEAIAVLWDFDPTQPQDRVQMTHDHLDSLYLKFEGRNKDLVAWEDFAKARKLGLIAA